MGKTYRNMYEEIYFYITLRFMLGRSTMKAIHLMKQMMEYYRARKRDLHIVYLEKAYDKVPREVFRWVMTKKGISRKYINIMQDMYQEVKTNLRSC